jgi:hypothetical protein
MGWVEICVTPTSMEGVDGGGRNKGCLVMKKMMIMVVERSSEGHQSAMHQQTLGKTLRKTTRTHSAKVAIYVTMPIFCQIRFFPIINVGEFRVVVLLLVKVVVGVTDVGQEMRVAVALVAGLFHLDVRRVSEAIDIILVLLFKQVGSIDVWPIL